MPIKIACVGDSITYGAFVHDRVRHCYPAQMAKRLGPYYQVRNFGANGCTIVRGGDHPYIERGLYQRSLDYLPDLVILMMGCNDSKTINWPGMEGFLRDYRAVLDTYRALPSHPRVILMTPPSLYVLPGSDEALRKERETRDLRIGMIAQEIERLAAMEHLACVNITVATEQHPEWFLRDGTHPDARGAGAIARLAYQAVKQQH